MKKIILVLVMIISVIVLCGCTGRDDMNVEVEDYWYLNTRDTKYVSTYNDYIISSYDIEETTGGYVVTLNVTLADSKTVTK